MTHFRRAAAALIALGFVNVAAAELRSACERPGANSAHVTSTSSHGDSHHAHLPAGSPKSGSQPSQHECAGNFSDCCAAIASCGGSFFTIVRVQSRTLGAAKVGVESSELLMPSTVAADIEVPPPRA